MYLTPSALYYVPKSPPPELVEQLLPSGKMHVITVLDCTNASDPGGSLSAVYGTGNPSYLLVQCYPPNSSSQQGILVDVKTGARWTLWTDGQESADGWYGGGAWVYGGWVYFTTYTVPYGHGLVQRAMNLATGATKPAASPLAQYVASYRAPDGTLYGMKWSSPASEDSVDLYRLYGPFESTLIAKNLPVDSGQGILSMLTIDANGTIWVPRQGGTLTPSAGAMTIRLAKPTPAPPKSKVIMTGIGYVVCLGSLPNPYAESPIQVTVATPHGTKTITVGHTPDVQDDFGAVPYTLNGNPQVTLAVYFPAPVGRWQIVTVSRGSSS